MPSTWQRRNPCVSVGIASPACCTGCQIEQRVGSGFYEKHFLLQENWRLSLFGCPFSVSWISFIRTALSGDVVCRSADVLNCYPLTANVVATWTRPWQMGRSGHMEKKKRGQQSLTRVSAILSLWETLEEYGLEQDWYQLTFSRVRAKLSRIIIYLSTVYSLTIVLNQRTQ